MRGYFAIGAERISKPMNLGNLLRSAHAFGAKFFFTIGAHPKAFEARSDTSKASFHLPVYHWATPSEMVLPLKCKLVGIELIEGATELPSFRHPLHAAYVLGPELGMLSEELLSMAGAIVMYDRVRSLGTFPDRMAEPRTQAGKPAEGGRGRGLA
jgi:tRNA G18 (ribose-2'-O)-methylase SpoU